MSHECPRCHRPVSTDGKGRLKDHPPLPERMVRCPASFQRPSNLKAALAREVAQR